MPSPHGEAIVSADRVSRDALYSAGKFLPPRLSERYMPRTRLDARLDDAADAHTIVVSGPAGGRLTLGSMIGVSARLMLPVANSL